MAPGVGGEVGVAGCCVVTALLGGQPPRSALTGSEPSAQRQSQRKRAREALLQDSCGCGDGSTPIPEGVEA